MKIICTKKEAIIQSRVDFVSKYLNSEIGLMLQTYDCSCSCEISKERDEFIITTPTVLLPLKFISYLCLFLSLYEKEFDIFVRDN